MKKVLSSEFEVKDLGHVKKVLGVRIRKENGMIKLDQVYIEKLLQKLGMSNCNILSTPMDVNCVVGTLTTRVPHKSIYGPFQGSVQHLHKRTDWTFSGSQKRPFAGPRSVVPTNHTSVYSDQS